MSNHGKHRRSFQILVIPDDKDEPKAYSVPVGRIKFYKILAFVLAAHIILGIVSYYQFFHLSIRNRQLVSLNQELTENNNRIFELQDKFGDLENSLTKIRTPLGLDERDLEAVPPENNDMTLGYIAGTTTNSQPVRAAVSDEDAIRAQIGFLNRSKSIVHNIERSIPTYLPVEGVLTQPYSEGEAGDDPHFAIDIAADMGSPVKAAADGIILYNGWDEVLGNMILIYHGNGFYTYYGHNQQTMYQRNAFVKKGDTIALLGNSGKSSAPHLHFEMWKDGVPLNPQKYILAFTGL